MRQAQQLAQRVEAEKPVAVYSSGLKRALQTAQAVSQRLSLPIQVDVRLSESCFGVWEGLTLEEIQARYPDVLRSWRSDPVHTRIPGGETAGECQQRAVAAVRKIAARHSGETVVVISHGGPIKTIVCSILCLDLAQRFRFSIDNACLTTIRWDGQDGRILMLNDAGHLGTESREVGNLSTADKIFVH